MASPAAGATLAQLPDELLIQICSKVPDPAPLSLTCKRLSTITKDTHLRAQWLLQRFQPYEALYEAICRPKMCSGMLMKLLLNGGAVLSRHLMQMLYAVHDPASKITIQTKWSSNLSCAALSVLDGRAKQLYGDWDRDPNQLDDLVFQDGNRNYEPPALIGQSHVSDEVVRLMEEKRFLPLPTCFCKSVRRPYHRMVTWRHYRGAADKMVCRTPQLIPLMRANGYELDHEAWKLDHFLDTEKLQVPRRVAANLVVSLCFCPWDHYLVGLSVLIALHREEKLAFDLEWIIAQVLSHFEKGVASKYLLTLLRLIRAELPQIDVRRLYVQATFLQSKGVDALAVDLEQCVVTEDDVLQACLGNDCVSIAPIRYALRFIKDFSLKSLMSKLLENLLHQPYRECMLDELKLFTDELALPQHTNVNFKQLLAAAVEKWAFSSTQVVPFREWSKDEQSSQLSCNPVQPIRSMIALDWYGQHDCALDFAKHSGDVPLFQLKPYLPTSPADAPGTTCVVAQDENHHRQWEEGTAQSQPGVLQDANEELDQSELILLPDYHLDEDEEPEAGVSGPLTNDVIWCQRYMYQNILGLATGQEEPLDVFRGFSRGGLTRGYGEAHVAKSIVIHLGAASNAAHVLLSHALANNNQTLAAELVGEGVAPTLELFRIAVRVGASLPRALFEQIKAGAPFRVGYDAAENVHDSSCETSEVCEQLTDEEIQHCQSVANASAWPRTISADVDAAGKLHVEKLDAPRSAPVATILRASSTPASPGLGSCSQAGVESTVPDEELPINYVLKLDGKQCVMDGFAYRQRLKSAMLWAQHLRRLKSAEVKLHAALNIVFEAEGQAFAAARSSARSDIGELIERLERVIEELQSAVPLLRPNMTLTDLREVWGTVRDHEAAEEVVLQQFKAFVRGSPSDISGPSQVSHERAESRDLGKGRKSEEGTSEPARKRFKLKHEEASKKLHPVYNHPLFDHDAFLEICVEAREAGEAEAVAENCYLEQLCALEDELTATGGDFDPFDEQLAEYVDSIELPGDLTKEDELAIERYYKGL